MLKLLNLINNYEQETHGAMNKERKMTLGYESRIYAQLIKHLEFCEFNSFYLLQCQN